MSPTRAQIVAEVAERHGLTRAEMKGPELARQYSRPRQEAMALMYAENRWSRGEIGAAVGRTCWTVTFGVDAHNARQLKSSTGMYESCEQRLAPDCDLSQSSRDVMA